MKAVLVLDMPKSCFDCQLMVDGWCYAVNADRTQDTISTKDRTCWCPLRQLPSFKAVDLNDTRDVVMFCHGWNTCLAEITGETE